MPADCKELFAVLSEYLDAELPAEQCAEIQAHIAACPPCVEFVNSLRKTIELCRATRMAAEPPPLSDEVRQELLTAFRRTEVNRGRPGS